MEHLHNIRLPAGWYPDPDGADHRRWWDGTTWTQHTAPFQRPVVVYEVDDLAEYRAHAKAKGAALDAAEAEKAATVPAPRRIRTAARLGRSLAALAHKLPFGLPSTDDPDDSDIPAAPQSERQTAKAAAAAKKPAAKKPASKGTASKDSAPTPPSDAGAAGAGASPAKPAAKKAPAKKAPAAKPAAKPAAQRTASKSTSTKTAKASTPGERATAKTAAKKSGGTRTSGSATSQKAKGSDGVDSAPSTAEKPAAKKPTTRSNPLTGAITPRSPGRHVR